MATSKNHCQIEVPPQVLIVDEPTRGVDVSARNDIYQLLRSIAAKMWLCCLSPPTRRDRTDGRSCVCDASGRSTHSELTERDINVETIMRVAFGDSQRQEASC